MNDSNKIPLLNAQSNNIGAFQPLDTEAGPSTGGGGNAGTSSRRQFANKYQANAHYVQETFDLSNAGHPVACIFTIGFKMLSLFCYIFLPSFTSQVLSFILVVLFGAVDFWTVKNVTGRLLVGLRWWSEPDEEGDEDWVFESYDERLIPNAIDSKFFWFSQIAIFVVWLVFSSFSILGFKLFWGTACLINCILSGTNLWGFYKCSKDHEAKVTELMKNAGTKVMTTAVNRMTGAKNNNTN